MPSEPVLSLTYGSSLLNEVLQFMKDMKELLVNKVFVVNVLGIFFTWFILSFSQALIIMMLRFRIQVIFNKYTFRIYFKLWNLFLGYVAYNFVIGAYSYWGPKAGYSIYQMVKALYHMTIILHIRPFTLSNFFPLLGRV